MVIYHHGSYMTIFLGALDRAGLFFKAKSQSHKVEEEQRKKKEREEKVIDRRVRSGCLFPLTWLSHMPLYLQRHRLFLSSQDYLNLSYCVSHVIPSNRSYLHTSPGKACCNILLSFSICSFCMLKIL